MPKEFTGIFEMPTSQFCLGISEKLKILIFINDIFSQNYKGGTRQSAFQKNFSKLTDFGTRDFQNEKLIGASSDFLKNGNTALIVTYSSVFLI